VKQVSVEFRDRIVKAITDRSYAIQRRAAMKAPVDTGLLRSATHVMLQRDAALGIYAAGVGVFVKYAPFMELGTARRGALTCMKPIPKGYRHGGAHNVSGKYLIGWARRHGLNPYAVAAGIRKHRGLRARPFLYPAFKAEVRFLEMSLRGILKQHALGRY
jgi:hypothetical protein